MIVSLETPRLLLRRFTEEDAELLLGLERDPEVLRYLGRKPLPDVEACRQHIRNFFLPYYERAEGYEPSALVEKSTGEFIGICSLKPALESRSAAAMAYEADQVELGYGLRQSSWGKGYATEAARAQVRKAFTQLTARWIVASALIANVASIRVLEKAGLRRVEGLFQFPGEDEPSVKYTLTREQYHFGEW